MFKIPPVVVTPSPSLSVSLSLSLTRARVGSKRYLTYADVRNFDTTHHRPFTNSTSDFCVGMFLMAAAEVAGMVQASLVMI